MSRADRQPLEREDGTGAALSGGSPSISAQVPCGWTIAPHAFAAEIRDRRFQLPASGPLRRACISAAGDLPALAAGSRFHRRRIPAHRAAPTPAVARRSRAAGRGRGRDFRGAPQAGRGHPRVLSREFAARREPAAQWRALHARRDFSRCQIAAARNGAAQREPFHGGIDCLDASKPASKNLFANRRAVLLIAVCLGCVLAPGLSAAKSSRHAHARAHKAPPQLSADAVNQAEYSPSLKLDQETWKELAQGFGQAAIVEYAISEQDVKGPFAKTIPNGLEKMARLDHLSYTSPLELLGEKFHIDPKLLTLLNPGKRFEEAGTSILVPNVGERDLSARVARIEVDKSTL